MYFITMYLVLDISFGKFVNTFVFDINELRLVYKETYHKK